MIAGRCEEAFRTRIKKLSEHDNARSVENHLDQLRLIQGSTGKGCNVRESEAGGVIRSVRIVESGRYDDLMERGGVFASLSRRSWFRPELRSARRIGRPRARGAFASRWSPRAGPGRSRARRSVSDMKYSSGS